MPARKEQRMSLLATGWNGQWIRPVCGVPSERDGIVVVFPGFHPSLVCDAPLGHMLGGDGMLGENGVLCQSDGMASGYEPDAPTGQRLGKSRSPDAAFWRNVG